MIFGLERQLVAELLLLGCTTGFLAGLLGIGGGMLMVPFMTLLLSQHGVDTALAVKMAIATSMATIMFTSLSSIRAHHVRGAIRWDLVRSLAPGITLMALLTGAFLYPLIRGTALALLFALFVGFSATRMMMNTKPTASAPMATANNASSSFVIPQILTNIRLPNVLVRDGVGCDRFLANGRATRRSPQRDRPR